MMRPFLVRPAMLYRTYRIDLCPVCGCSGWHVWYDTGACKHANGVTYGAGALVARMVELMTTPLPREDASPTPEQPPAQANGLRNRKEN
jgi:hypothetical protein